ncbi:MAG: asparagine synthase-related protein [Thermodesulfobacteriota bacterium]
MNVALPHLTFSWQKQGATTISIADGIFPAGDGLVIGLAGYRPRPMVLENPLRSVAVVGTPVAGNRVSARRVAEDALVAASVRDFARELNGQFLLLVLDRRERQLSVVSDRFNGVPVYWADLGDRFVGAYLYFDLFRHLRQTARVALRPEVMLQFLWFNRVLLDDTYDSASRFLMPATVLQVDAAGTRQERYWRPDFTKRHRRVRAAGDEYVTCLRRSLARQTTDDFPRRYGHFLSGGHDSRSVLAAFPEPPECLTVAFSDNLEVECARKAAAAVGARHHFLCLPDDHMVRHFDDSVRLCGGLYSFLNALFIGLETQVQEVADVVFHGHGLDYLFQGMYLPARWIELFGRPTFFRRLEPFNGDLVNRYLFGIPFRVKGADIPALLRREAWTTAMDGLQAAVSAVIRDGDDVCRTDYDRWEYLIIHALGRHYSHPNIDSKLTCAEQRTPCFDNDLFDFYLSLPPELRVEGEMMRYALNTMNPALGRIPTGNWGMPAGASPAVKTAWLVGRKILRHLTGNPRLRAPALEDRTWPNSETYLRRHPRLVEEVRVALSSDELEETLAMFDWPVLRCQGERWLTGEDGGAAFLMALATLHRFLTLAR